MTFIDSDDFVHREYIEKLLRPCLEQKAEVTIGSFQKVQENAELIGHADTALTGVETRGATGLEANYRLCDSKDRDWLRTTVAWGKLIKRELIVKIRFPVGMLHEDEATSYRYLYEAAKVVYVDAVIYFYRDTPGSIMNSKFSDKNLDYLDILDERSWFYLSCGEQELADKTIWQCYWTILDFCYKTLQEDEKRPGRIKRLRMAMIRLCKMALRRSSIPGRTKIRYLISVPFMKAVSRHYNLK